MQAAWTTKGLCVCVHIIQFNSIQFILYSPLSQITNVPLSGFTICTHTTSMSWLSYYTLLCTGLVNGFKTFTLHRFNICVCLIRFYIFFKDKLNLIWAALGVLSREITATICSGCLFVRVCDDFVYVCVSSADSKGFLSGICNKCNKSMTSAQYQSATSQPRFTVCVCVLYVLRLSHFPVLSQFTDHWNIVLAINGLWFPNR